MQQMKESAAQFFSLPLETKNTVAVRGDSIQGFGHHFSGASSDKLDWAECLLLFTHRVQDRNMDFWPSEPPTFRHALDRYSMEIARVTKRLLGFMAADLGVSDGDDAVKGQSMSMHHYPPCRRHRDKVVGIPPHTDSPALTLLLQVDDTPGLQIRRGGRWFPVRPMPGALLVNVGNILEVLTNGAYGSIEHRVVPDAERGRTTVVMFQDASADGLVGPLPELLGGDDARARYRSIGRDEYTKGHFVAVAQGTPFLHSLKK
ncbi:hypothetical protein HU200_018262 [Digitaria exilis]|uniref:Fe2OG dioxygenase domain-containing protein n=1 Tax=Digitaria exilis TaxID=1010633 RepID=A0A835F5Q6_9POAL|nr:hypothetical protein HU200_018262 [Digitaria exilis]